jgi:Rad3-related DNA helicase
MNLSDSPSPRELNLPKIDRFWPHQIEAIRYLRSPLTPVQILISPTGTGKTAILIATARVSRLRTYYLTAERRLQEQVREQCPDAHIFWGQDHYPCIERHERVPVSQGPCQSGYDCPVISECYYYRDKFLVRLRELTAMNYAVYLTDRRFVGDLPPPGMLACDEAHAIEDELVSALSVVIRREDCLSVKLPFPDLDITSWYMSYRDRVASEVRAARLRRDRAALKRWTRLDAAMRGLDTVTGDPDNWVIESATGDEIVLQPIEVKPFASLLWQGAGRIVLTSATIPDPAYLAEMLALPEYDVYRVPSQFDPRRRPVVIDPISRSVVHRNEPAIWDELVAKCDMILERFPNVRGLIHTGSYERARMLKDRSRYRDRLVVPGPSDRNQVLARWPYSRPDAVLVSPSMTEGIDLPGDLLRFQIVLKVPFLFRGSPRIRAKLSRDPRYEPYRVAMTITQMAGRAMRSFDDYGVTYIIDPSIRMVLSNWRELFPEWFLDAVVWG